MFTANERLFKKSIIEEGDYDGRGQQNGSLFLTLTYEDGNLVSQGAKQRQGIRNQKNLTYCSVESIFQEK